MHICTKDKVGSKQYKIISFYYTYSKKEDLVAKKYLCLVLGDVRYASTKHKDLQGPVSWIYMSWKAELTLL